MTKELNDSVIEMPGAQEDAIDKISHDEIIRAVQKLSPGYRAVFNLFVIEGFSHEEISNHLGISIGTSKSNLNKAKRNLQKILLQFHQTILTKNVI